VSHTRIQQRLLKKEKGQMPITVLIKAYQASAQQDKKIPLTGVKLIQHELLKQQLYSAGFRSVRNEEGMVLWCRDVSWKKITVMFKLAMDLKKKGSEGDYYFLEDPDNRLILVEQLLTIAATQGRIEAARQELLPKPYIRPRHRHHSSSELMRSVVSVEVRRSHSFSL